MGGSFDLKGCPDGTDGTRLSCARNPRPANLPSPTNKAHGFVTRGPAKSVPVVSPPAAAFRRRPGLFPQGSDVLLVLRLLGRLDLAAQVLQRLLQLHVLELLLGLGGRLVRP